MIGKIEGEEFEALGEEEKTTQFLETQDAALTLQDGHVALLQDVRTPPTLRTAIATLVEEV